MNIDGVLEKCDLIRPVSKKYCPRPWDTEITRNLERTWSEVLEYVPREYVPLIYTKCLELVSVYETYHVSMDPYIGFWRSKIRVL